MTELELIKKAKDGDAQATNELIELFKPLVTVIARKYFFVNSSFDDVVQEGMLGLFKAYLNYDLNSKISFKKYASVCINHQIQTAIKANNANKNLPLNTYLSVNNQGKILLSIKTKPKQDEEDENGFFISSSDMTPEESVLFKEKILEINTRINEILSSYEKKVLHYYVLGLNYVEIAEKLKKEPKSIDNALSRIKIKLKDVKCI